MRLLILFIVTLFSLNANAWWGYKDKTFNLNSDHSTVHFISIKNEQIAESHRFNKLKGTIDKDGIVEVSIELDSVDTLIPIRNERMKEFLFKTSEYPNAVITSQINMDVLRNIRKGKRIIHNTSLTLDLHGHTKTFNVDLVVSTLKTEKSKKRMVFVSTVKPIIINAADFGLLDGVNKLKDLAGLSSIVVAVPVSVELVFDY